MTSTKRVGILTFHRCINYGSYWQARCLVEGIRARGHDAVLLDHHSNRVNIAEWRCALRPIPEADTHRAAYRQKTRHFFQAFEKLPLSKPFPLLAPEQSEAFDVVLVGSDEVWNQRHPWYGSKGIFYGDGLNTARLASYAASFGNHSAAEGLDDYWASRLERFDDISVRDRNSQALAAAATGMAPTLVLDPCLQFGELIPRDAPSRDDDPYVLVYGHEFPDWLTRNVAAWARAEGVRLVSVGYDNPWVDEQNIAAGPLEFAGLVAGARGVVTNFFHGCVFALVTEKPFITAPSDYRFNKVRDLVVSLGAERHMVGESTKSHEYERIMNDKSAAGVQQNIDALKVQSNAYLDHVLA